MADPDQSTSDVATRPGSAASAVGVIAVWLSAVAVVGFLLWWPVHANLALANDAVHTFRLADTHGAIGAMKEFWGEKFFRPLDVIGAVLIDGPTSDARLTMLVHVPALLAILAAIGVATRRLLPDSRSARAIAFPVAVIWFGLHTSTTVSVWMPHSISQSWAAAAGVWLGLALWTGLDRLHAGKPVLGSALTLTLLGVIGMLSKEVFPGWCAGGVAVLVLCFVASRRSGGGVGAGGGGGGDQPPASLGRWALLLLPLIAVPALHFFVRYQFGGLGEAFESGDAGGDTRYRMAFGSNLVINPAVAGLVYFGAAPIHLLRTTRDPLLLAVPLVGVVTSFAVSVFPWILNGLRVGVWDDRPSFGVVVLIAGMSFAGVSVALVTPHVSELYLMGPNAGAAVLVAVGFVGLWSQAGSVAGAAGRVTRRLGVVGLGAIVLAVGVFGLASRAVHFRVVWETAAVLRNAIVAYQDELPDSDRVVTVSLPRACLAGPRHGQYIMPPAQSLNWPETAVWLNERHPRRPIEFAVGGPTPMGQFRLDCTGLPAHPGW